jgi:hypothetical protein
VTVSTLIIASWPWEWSPTTFSRLGLLVSVMTLLVLLGAAVVAWRQVKEAQRLRKEQARPFIVIDFDARATIVELRITNIGRTIARDVTFDFNPPLASTHDSQHGRGPLMELNLFKDGIPSLAPGKEIKIFFDQFPARVEAKLPMTYRVTVNYRDNAGESYTDPTVLDLDMYLGTGGVTRHGLHHIHKELKTIAETMKKWTDPFGGIKTLSRSDIKERNAELEAKYEEDERAAVAREVGAEVAEGGNGNGTPDSDPA